MSRKRTGKYVAEPGFNSASLSDAKNHIRQFLESVLPQMGLIRGRDYQVSLTQLRIRHIKTIVGKITVMLREVFPVFNFYWKTPRVLVWF